MTAEPAKITTLQLAKAAVAAARGKRGDGMVHVQFISHHRIPTRSDHDAYIVTYVVTSRRGAKIILRIGTWNAGNGTDDDMRRVLAACDVLCGQEWSDRRDLTRVARKAGFRSARFAARGSDATPLFTRKGIKRARLVWRLLLPSRWLGGGAGPSRNKPKGAEGAVCVWHGVRFGALSLHLPPTQGKELREQAAVDQVRELHEFCAGSRIVWFAGMDSNTVPGKPPEQYLIRQGWKSSQRAGGPVGTHGTRPIDVEFWLLPAA